MQTRGLQGVGAATVVTILLTGCQTPLSYNEVETSLQRSIDAAVARELTGLPEEERLQTAKPPGEVEQELASRLDELETISPLGAPVPEGEASYADTVPLLGQDLTGGKAGHVQVDLQWAISTAVERNLEIQLSRLQPAINETDVIAAESQFDAVLYSSANLTRTDQPSTVPVLDGFALGTPFNNAERTRFETGLRQAFRSGGTITASTDVTRDRINDTGLALEPDPAYTAALRLSLTQPLLRGFGSEVNTATIRISRNAERRSIEQLRADLLRIVDSTEAAYWDLVVSWRELQIRQWLLDRGIEDRTTLGLRRDFDTKPAQYSDAVARVEQRRADVIRGQRAVKFASDRLKQLINDSELTVGSETLLMPVDHMVELPVRYNLADAIQSAVGNRPEVQQAILNIDDASIRQLVADNARLPLLDLSAQIAYFGLDDAPDAAYDDLFVGDFIDYAIGLQFEQPIGNRGAEAGFRRARLERSATVIDYRRTVQDIVLDVKNALRNVVTNYELIGATRSFRIAQAENLRTLEVEEETIGALTPEFLDLKFTRQERLAGAQRDEIRAMADYNKAIASLYRAMGVGLDMNGIDVEIVDETGDVTDP